MKLYREAKPLEIVDNKAIWIDKFVVPLDLTWEEIYNILVEEIMGCDGPEKRMAAKAVLSKLKGDGE